MATPRDMPKAQHQHGKKDKPGKDDALAKAYEDGWKAGQADGKRSVRTMVLTFLQKEYTSPSVERGSPHGTEILELTKRLSQLLSPKK